MKDHEINDLINRYKNLGKDIRAFIENQREVSELALDIFIEIAKISSLDLKQVSLIKEAMAHAKEVLLETAMPPIPEFGDIEISNTKGTVIFVDITKSTDYFKEEKNYTGFVIFNAYILLVKTITRLTGGEFLEHTGDGALIFYRDRDRDRDFTLKYLIEGCNKENPICLYFIVSEYIKDYAEKQKLLSFKRDKNGFLIKEPSLVHIGAAYGEVLEVDLGDMKKLISKTVWDAAKRCKEADREVEYEVKYHGDYYYKTHEYDKYKKLPIKVSDY